MKNKQSEEKCEERILIIGKNGFLNEVMSFFYVRGGEGRELKGRVREKERER